MRPLLFVAALVLVAALASPFIFVQSSVHEQITDDANSAMAERLHGQAILACAEALPQSGLVGTMRVRNKDEACHACDQLLSPMTEAGEARVQRALRYVRTHDDIRARLATLQPALAKAVERRAAAMADEGLEIQDPYMDGAGEAYCTTYASFDLRG